MRPKALFLSTMVKTAFHNTLSPRCEITKQTSDGYFENMDIFIFLEMDGSTNGGSGSFGSKKSCRV